MVDIESSVNVVLEFFNMSLVKSYLSQVANKSQQSSSIGTTFWLSISKIVLVTW